jgi:hypothetical protein
VTGNVVINNPSNANTASLTTGIIDNTNVTLRIREVIIGVTTFSGSGGETTVPAMCQSYTLEPKFSTNLHVRVQLAAAAGRAAVSLFCFLVWFPPARARAPARSLSPRAFLLTPLPPPRSAPLRSAPLHPTPH